MFGKVLPENTTIENNLNIFVLRKLVEMNLNFIDANVNVNITFSRVSACMYVAYRGKE